MPLHRRSPEGDSPALDGSITRRDLLGGTLLGVGTALLHRAPPAMAQPGGAAWQGYGGVGEYAASNGNTWEVLEAAHQVRDGRFAGPLQDVTDTGETFDLVIVGAGFAGLGAAWSFKKTWPAVKRCLLLDNHPIFGGEGKQNEFMVDGERLLGPQGSNLFRIPAPEEPSFALNQELGIPSEFSYQEWNPSLRPLELPRENYAFMLWGDRFRSNGWFYDQESHGVEPRWARDIWSNDLAEAPYAGPLKRDLLRWRTDTKRYHDGADFERWLDSMSYEAYLTKVMGLSPEVARYADPILAAGVGLGCDALSAYAAYTAAMPGLTAFSRTDADDYIVKLTGTGRLADLDWHGFPGGNTLFARCFVKALIPAAIAGTPSLDDVHNRQVDFAALDRSESPIRIRLDSTVVRVEHAGAVETADHVQVTYVRHGELQRLKARTVVMASGGWINRHVVGDLPAEYHDAYDDFIHAPILVVNVALRSWKFLYDLGITGCRWEGGFGFSCNIRRPMLVGECRQPLDPGRPIVLTFYVPFCYPGLPAREQGERGRKELLQTSYAEYERRIIAQMVRLFGRAGFDAERDVAGIVLNRWGHAYVVPQPGFFFGRDGRPAPRDVVRRRFGRIAIGHSELQGLQSRMSGFLEAQRAVAQLREV
jgi:spermidine dehydrogenase